MSSNLADYAMPSEPMFGGSFVSIAESSAGKTYLVIGVTVALLGVLVLSLIASGVTSTFTSRMTADRGVAEMSYTGANSLNATLQDGANQGSGTNRPQIGTPNYSEEQSQFLQNQASVAKQAFTSRFLATGPSGPLARYVPPYTPAPTKTASEAAAAAASAEQMASGDDQYLSAAMAGY